MAFEVEGDLYRLKGQVRELEKLVADLRKRVDKLEEPEPLWHPLPASGPVFNGVCRRCNDVLSACKCPAKGTAG